MACSIEKINEDKFKITVTADQESYRSNLEATYRKMAKDVSIPGFRKGRVPFQIAIKYFGEQAFLEELPEDYFADLVRQSLYEYIKENYEFIETSPIHIVESDIKKGLVFEFSAFTMPKAEKVKDYKELVIYKEEPEVKEEEIDQHIEAKRKELARLEDLEPGKEIQQDDHLEVLYDLSIDGEKVEEGKHDHMDAGGYKLVDGLGPSLLGHKVGETSEVTLTFPEEYYQKDRAGKEGTFTIEVLGGQRTVLPDLDDEFVKDVSETADTVDEYREEIRKDLLEELKVQLRNEFRDRIGEGIVECYESSFLPEVVAARLKLSIQDFARNVSQRFHLSLEQFLSITGTDINEFSEDLRKNVEKELKMYAGALQIFGAENLSVDDADLDEKRKSIYEYTKQTDRLETPLREDVDFMADYYVNLLNDARIHAVLDFLENTVKTTDVPPEPEEVEEPEGVEASEDAEAAEGAATAEGAEGAQEAEGAAKSEEAAE